MLWFILVLILAIPVYGQQTVQVSPGDDLQSALNAAGAGGTVVFAPGRYDVVPSNPYQHEAIRITQDLAGITLRGAGCGTDPNTATILDGEAGFLETGVLIEASNVTVEGFTLTQFWIQGFLLGDRIQNVECRNCWALACDSGMNTAGTAGVWSESNPDRFDTMVRFRNCVFARGGDDAADIENGSTVVFIQCDFYDFDSDMLAPEDTSVILLRNCILHAGLHSDNIQADGASLIEARNCVFYDPTADDHDGLGGMDFRGFTYTRDCIGKDPLYVRVGPDVPVWNLDFRLRAGSPALTAGKDEKGNPTFAGSMGGGQ
jgi:hypothetical protein